MKRGDIKRYREYLNDLHKNSGKHRENRFQQRERPYGDYLYFQDRERFMVELEEWVKTREHSELTSQNSVII